MAAKSSQQLPPDYKPGLEGVVAGESDIADVNPDLDALIYRGYRAHELAEKASFEEVAHLILLGKLPSRAELKPFQEEMIKERSLPSHVISILKELPASPHPMVSFQLAVILMGMVDPDAKLNTPDANLAKAKRLLAKAPTLVAALYRISQGKDPVAPNPNLDHASNFLFMLTGKEPDQEVGQMFGSALIMYMEHGFNASTFAALVTVSTLSDLYSRVASAIGTLKGPLHGGANQAAMEMLLKIGEVENVEPWLKNALVQKEKIMGFGHRIYKKIDSRTPEMKRLAERMSQKVGDKKIYPMALALDQAMQREKKIPPNVDYYGAVVFYLMGLPIEIYTPIFAMSRVAGWTAHVMEQLANNRLIRPDCHYTGPQDLPFVPIEKRT